MRKTGSSHPSLHSAMFPGQHRLVVLCQNSIWREEKGFENFLKLSLRKVGLPANFNSKCSLRSLAHVDAVILRQEVKNTCFPR